MAKLVKTVAGLAIASVKTINGLAIASVKAISGLDNTAGGGCSETPVLACGLAGDGAGYQSGLSVPYLGTEFTAPSAGTVCKVGVSLLDPGTATDDVTFEIWSNNAGTPSAKIGSSSSAINGTEIGASYADYYFEFTDSDIELASGTNYWLVLKSTSGIEWERKGSGCSPEYVKSSADGSSWTSVTTLRAMVHEIYYET